MNDNWEKIVLASALALAAAMAGYWAFTFPTAEEIKPSNLKKGSLVKPVSDEVAQLPEKWAAEPQWTVAGNHRMFRPQDFWFFPDVGQIKPIKDDTVIKDPITKGWADRFGFDPTDPMIDVKDPDGDGFNNATEFTANTSPTDPDSRPDITNLLRLAESKVIQFRLKFRSVLDATPGKEIFAINILLEGTKERSNIVRRGEMINGYKVVGYEKKIVQEASGGQMIEVDRSELKLLREDINEEVILIRGLDKASPDYQASFIMLLPPNPEKPIAQVKRGEEFEIPKDPGTKYRLQRVDANGQSATILNTKNNKSLEVPKLRAGELKAVPQSESTP